MRIIGPWTVRPFVIPLATLFGHLVIQVGYIDADIHWTTRFHTLVARVGRILRTAEPDVRSMRGVPRTAAVESNVADGLEPKHIPHDLHFGNALWHLSSLSTNVPPRRLFETTHLFGQRLQGGHGLGALRLDLGLDVRADGRDGLLARAGSSQSVHSLG